MWSYQFTHLDGPLGLQEAETPRTWRWKGCKPYAPAAFTPRRQPWYTIHLEAESIPGESAAGRIMSRPWGREPAIFRLTAQRHNRKVFGQYNYAYTAAVRDDFPSFRIDVFTPSSKYRMNTQYWVPFKTSVRNGQCGCYQTSCKLCN